MRNTFYKLCAVLLRVEKGKWGVEDAVHCSLVSYFYFPRHILGTMEGVQYEASGSSVCHRTHAIST